MLSGIGPADHLNQHGIKVEADLEGVGRNLMDHTSVILQYECKKQFPIHRVDRPLNKLAAGVQWVFTRGGIAASNIWEAGGLIRGNADVLYPNLQYHFGPVAFEYNGNDISLMQGFAMHVDQQRPRSRGRITLASADPQDKPKMAFEYLSDPHDLRELIEGVHKARDLVSQATFDELRGAEMIPGPDVRSDAEIADWIKTAVTTEFHPCGTCRMGEGEDCVVDPQFRVHGVDGLWVVDASVMPRITSANLNAPTQMMAARAADFIAGRDQKTPEVVPFAFED